jgi:hypothetical protein
MPFCRPRHFHVREERIEEEACVQKKMDYLTQQQGGLEWLSKSLIYLPFIPVQ